MRGNGIVFFQFWDWLDGDLPFTGAPLVWGGCKLLKPGMSLVRGVLEP